MGDFLLSFEKTCDYQNFYQKIAKKKRKIAKKCVYYIMRIEFIGKERIHTRVG